MHGLEQIKVSNKTAGIGAHAIHARKRALRERARWVELAEGGCSLALVHLSSVAAMGGPIYNPPGHPNRTY